jgi:hypothetical protein
MNEETLFDPFFKYLQEIEAFPFLRYLDPQKTMKEECSIQPKKTPLIVFDR